MDQPGSTGSQGAPTQSWTRRARWIAVAIAVVVLAVDQASKAWAEASLPVGSTSPCSEMHWASS